MDDWYTTDEVAQMVSRELGEDVTTTAIHQAVHRLGQRPNARQRATSGLPAPVKPGERPLRFPRDQIDTWLQNHPRRAQERLTQHLKHEMAASEGRRAAAIATGRQAGMSWQQLADLIGAVDQVPISRQAIARKYA